MKALGMDFMLGIVICIVVLTSCDNNTQDFEYITMDSIQLRRGIMNGDIWFRLESTDRWRKLSDFYGIIIDMKLKHDGYEWSPNYFDNNTAMQRPKPSGHIYNDKHERSVIVIDGIEYEVFVEERLMATAQEIAREYFPDVSNELLEHIIWHETGFPCFWTGDCTPEECFRRQLQEAKIKMEKKNAD